MDINIRVGIHPNKKKITLSFSEKHYISCSHKKIILLYNIIFYS